MKNTMIAFSILSLFTFLSSRAESPKEGDASWDIKKIAKQNIKIDAAGVRNQLDAMVKSGQLTAEQAEAAKAQLSQMDDSELKRIEQQAKNIVLKEFDGKNLNRMPANYLPDMKRLHKELKRVEKKGKDL